jgi:serine/threonine protein kinase
MPLSAGARLGAYEVLAPLGAGGTGEVYRAHDRKLDRDVAIKILPEALAADPDRIARFEREATRSHSNAEHRIPDREFEPERETSKLNR